MLYLHCGWPRTGTSSLQYALAKNRDWLATTGLVYPDCWNPKGVPAHHGLGELLEASLVSGDGFEELIHFLGRHSGDDVLLSAESLTNWLLTKEKQDAFLRLLMMAQETIETRCIWTLRRLDDLLSSLYLLRLARDGETPPVDEHFTGLPAPDPLFEGLQRVEDAVGGDVVYVGYDQAGGHNRELLHAFELADTAAAVLQRELDQVPRLNARLGHKQAVTLLNLEALSAKVGVELDGAALRAAFRRGELSFDGDRPCELPDDEVKRDLREQALAAARRQGFSPYVDFFGDAVVGQPASVALGPQVLTDEDLRILA